MSKERDLELMMIAAGEYREEKEESASRSDVSCSALCPFAALMDDAMMELLDMAAAGHSVEIRFVPGQGGGESSYLMWKPVGGEEVSIREHVPDLDPPNVRQVWLIGDPVRELREFLSQNSSVK